MVELVKSQVQEVNQAGKLVSGVILVGGFGQSEHLLNTLRIAFGADYNQPLPQCSGSHQATGRGIPIHRSDKPWSAVARGALLQHFSGNLVIERRCRHNYGMKVPDVPFNAQLHPQRSKVYNTNTNKAYAEGVVDWLIRKGQPLKTGSPVLKEITLTFDANSPRTTRRFFRKVFSSHHKAAPKILDDGCREVFDISINLSTVPDAMYTMYQDGHGNRYLETLMTLEMKMTSGGLAFSCRVGDKNYGLVEKTFGTDI